jgi:hypothetical protein
MFKNSIDYSKFNIKKDGFEFLDYLEERNRFVNSTFQAKNAKITDFGTEPIWNCLLETRFI